MASWVVQIKGYLPDTHITRTELSPRSPLWREGDDHAAIETHDLHEVHEAIEAFVNKMLGHGHDQIRVELNNTALLETPQTRPISPEASGIAASVPVVPFSGSVNLTSPAPPAPSPV
jgi:hypothetical protein